LLEKYEGKQLKNEDVMVEKLFNVWLVTIY
jgi:hypothetical protein